MISEAAGDARNTTAPATSIGSPTRCRPAIRSRTSRLEGRGLREPARRARGEDEGGCHGVDRDPVALPIRPRGTWSGGRSPPSSCSRPTPPAARRTPPANRGSRCVRSPARSSLAPPLDSTKNVPFRFTARVRSKSSSSDVLGGVLRSEPGVVDQDVDPLEPRRRRRRPLPRSGQGRSRPSAIDSARRPIPSICSARSPAVVTSRSPRTTSAPAFASASEIARPRPRAAPVTMATWPPRSNRGKLSAVIRARSIRRAAPPVARRS